MLVDSVKFTTEAGLNVETSKSLYIEKSGDLVAGASSIKIPSKNLMFTRLLVFVSEPVVGTPVKFLLKKNGASLTTNPIEINVGQEYVSIPVSNLLDKYSQVGSKFEIEVLEASTGKNLVCQLDYQILRNSIESPIIVEREVLENTTSVGIIPNAVSSGESTYSINGGADAAKFILSPTGLLSFVDAPDYETPASAAGTNVYRVEIYVTTPEETKVSHIVRVEVVNILEYFIPYLNNTLFSIQEGNLEVGTLEATANSSPTFTIEGGADASKFDLVNGVLSFKTAPDYAIPSSSLGTNIYSLDIRIIDNQTSAVSNVRVTVTEMPAVGEVTIIPYLNVTLFNIAENTTAIATLSAVANSTPTFALDGGADEDKFNLTSNGILSFKLPPDYENPGSNSESNSYQVNIKITDIYETSTNTVIVNVTDVVDTATPYLNSTTINILENTSAVATLSATSVGTPSFTIEGGADADKFDLLGNSLSFKVAPDYEAPGSAAGTNTYFIDIRVTDSQNSNVNTVKINVTNVSDVPANAWLTPMQFKLDASDKAAGDQFGISNTISRDGNTIVVGARHSYVGGVDVGAAYVFVKNSGVWSQQAKLVASDGAFNDQFGQSVAISSDGNTVIVGAHGQDVGGSDAGAAYIFVRSGTTWTQQTKLQATDKQAGDWFGINVALSANGNTALVGARYEDTGALNAGAAYVFTRGGTNWAQQAKLQSGNKYVNAWFGHSVALSVDGNTALISARQETVSGKTMAGALYAFTRSSGGVWTQQQRIVVSNPKTDMNLGHTISLSDDGNIALVGALADSTYGTDSGSAFFFVRNNGVWTQQQKVYSSDIEVGDWFGISTALSATGDIAVIGARQEATGGAGTGSAYVFVRNNGIWTQRNKIQALDKNAGDNFATTIASTSDGNTMVLGSFLETTGTAYVFEAFPRTPVVTPSLNTTTFNVPENSTAVGTLSAISNGLCIFNIESGADADKFNLTQKGVLSFKVAPDYETPGSAASSNTYSLSIRITDSQTSAVVPITVNVTDVVEYFVPYLNVSSFNMPENSTAVATLTATANSAPTFSINGGADASKFNLTSGGALSFKVAPDYETPNSSLNTNVYKVNVQITDVSGNTIVPVTVNVTDVAEYAYLNTSTFNASENIKTVATLSATAIGTPSFALAGGADADKFNLTTQGVLSFITAPDFETPGSAASSNTYSFNVSITDNQGTSIVPVTVNVVNAAENFTGPAVYGNSSAFTRYRAIQVDPATGNVFIMRNDYTAHPGAFNDTDYVTIIKLDNNLNYVNHTTIDRGTREGVMQSMFLTNNSIYVAGPYKDYSTTLFNGLISRFDLNLNHLASTGLTGPSSSSHTYFLGVGPTAGSGNVNVSLTHDGAFGATTFTSTLGNTNPASYLSTPTNVINTSLAGGALCDGHVNGYAVFVGISQPNGADTMPVIHATNRSYAATDSKQVAMQITYPGSGSDVYARSLKRRDTDYYMFCTSTDASANTKTMVTKFTFANLGVSSGLTHIKTVKTSGNYSCLGGVVTDNGVFSLSQSGILKFDHNLNFVSSIQLAGLGIADITNVGNDIYALFTKGYDFVVIKFQDLTEFYADNFMYNFGDTNTIAINNTTGDYTGQTTVTPTVTGIAKTSQANTTRTSGLTIGNRNGAVSISTTLNIK